MREASPGLSRRTFLTWGLVTAASGLLAACGQQAPTPPASKDSAPAAARSAPTATAQVQVALPPPAQSAPAATKPDVAAPTSAPAAAKPAEAAKPVAQVKRGGTLKIHRQNDWPTLDPHTAQSNSLDMILGYEYLTQLVRNPQTGVWEIKPGLAQSWETPDPQTVVLKLQPNVKFHDGTDFNAEAVKWNLERMMNHPKSTAKVYVGAIQSVEAVDPLTVRLKLKSPSPTLFVNLSRDSDNVAAMMSPTWAQKVGDEGIGTGMVGTGPFKFAEFLASNQLTYKKFEGYWKQGADGKPLPYPDEAIVKYQADWSAALVQLRTGDLDLMWGVAGRDLPSVESDPKLAVSRSPWAATMYFISFNARPGARFAGDGMKKVRQAVNYAIDREAIARAVGAGIGAPNYYHLVPGQIGYNDKLPKYDYNPDKAKQLLSEAGFPNGFEVTLDFVSRPEDQQSAQVYQQMLEKVGIRMTLRPSERVAWVQKTLAGDYEMGTFIASTNADPDIALGYRFAKTGVGNYAGVDNPEIDALLDTGRTTYDVAKRQEVYEKVQQIVADEAYVGFVWRREGVAVMQKSVQGFEAPWAQLLTQSTGVWLDR